MNSGTLIAAIREKLDASVDVGSGPWSNRDLLGNLNAALRFLSAHRISVHPYGFMRVGLLSDLGATVTQAGSGLYHISLPSYVMRVLRMEHPDTSKKLPVEAKPVDTVKSRDRRPGYDDSQPILDQWLPGFQNGLIYRGGGSPTLSEVRLWYVHRPPDLVRFTVAEGSTSDTIYVDDVRSGGEDTAEWDEPIGYLSPLESHYVGMEIQVVSAFGSAPEGEIRRVTAYGAVTYPAYSFALDSEFDSSIPVGAVIDMRPMIDPLWEELIIYTAASRALDRVAYWPGREALRAMATELFQSWASLVANPQGQEPGRIAWGWDA